MLAHPVSSLTQLLKSSCDQKTRQIRHHYLRAWQLSRRFPHLSQIQLTLPFWMT